MVQLTSFFLMVSLAVISAEAQVVTWGNVGSTQRTEYTISTDTDGAQDSVAITQMQPDTGTIIPRNANSSVSEKTLSCPAGYNKIGKQCMQTFVEDSELTCPSGYTLTSSETCERYISRESGCPDGFTQTEGVCRRQEIVDMVRKCLDGYLIKSDGLTCVRTIQRENMEVCPAGTTQTGDLCINEIVESANYVCPPGFTLQGAECVIEEIYNCTPDLKGGNSESNFTYSYLSSPLKYSTVSVDPSQTVTSNPTVVYESKKAMFTGQESLLTQTQNRSFVRTMVMPVTTYGARRPVLGNGPRRLGVRHAPGAVNFMRRFSSSTVTPMPQQSNNKDSNVKSSEEGYDEPSVRGSVQQNIVISVQPGQQSTSSQTDLEMNVDCLNQTTINTFSLADPPKVFEKEAVYEDYVINSTCSRIRREAAHRVCERGVLDGDKCRTHEEVQSIILPGGIDEETVEAFLGCPDGYSPISSTSDQCITYDDVALTFFCPSGTQDLTDRCLIEVPARRTCNPGFELDNDRCVQISFTEPILEYTVQYSCIGKNCGGA